MKFWILFFQNFVLENKKSPLLFLFWGCSCFLFSCVSTPAVQIQSNLNPPAISFGTLGSFLFVIDIKIPRSHFKKSPFEQQFTSNYLADHLRKYLQSPSMKSLLNLWSKCSSLKKNALWKKMLSKVHFFLSERIKKLNQINKYVKIQKIALEFHWKKRKK